MKTTLKGCLLAAAILSVLLAYDLLRYEMRYSVVYEQDTKVAVMACRYDRWRKVRKPCKIEFKDQTGLSTK